MPFRTLASSLSLSLNSKDSNHEIFEIVINNQKHPDGEFKSSAQHTIWKERCDRDFEIFWFHEKKKIGGAKRSRESSDARSSDESDKVRISIRRRDVKRSF